MTFEELLQRLAKLQESEGAFVVNGRRAGTANDLTKERGTLTQRLAETDEEAILNSKAEKVLDGEKVEIDQKVVEKVIANYLKRNIFGE